MELVKSLLLLKHGEKCNVNLKINEKFACVTPSSVNNKPKQHYNPPDSLSKISPVKKFMLQADKPSFVKETFGSQSQLSQPTITGKPGAFTQDLFTDKHNTQDDLLSQCSLAMEI